ncbi:nucleoside transporter C-terminal domain-containing protein [Streptomyces sp. NPDC059828]|uniref:nucleoside transporter C-terminal domain-containing protein n=1 Tax=Streptomyces sp. NPDC059828 TaxID=3346965 RepID=UPI00365974EC
MDLGRKIVGLRHKPRGTPPRRAVGVTARCGPADGLASAHAVIRPASTGPPHWEWAHRSQRRGCRRFERGRGPHRAVLGTWRITERWHAVAPGTTGRLRRREMGLGMPEEFDTEVHCHVCDALRSDHDEVREAALIATTCQPWDEYVDPVRPLMREGLYDTLAETARVDPGRVRSSRRVRRGSPRQLRQDPGHLAVVCGGVDRPGRHQSGQRGGGTSTTPSDPSQRATAGVGRRHRGTRPPRAERRPPCGRRGQAAHRVRGADRPGQRLLRGGGKLVRHRRWGSSGYGAWIFAPVAWLGGVPWDEASAVDSLLGQKSVVDEFVAYASFDPQIHSLEPKAVLSTTFTRAGFATSGSIAIRLVSFDALAPERGAMWPGSAFWPCSRGRRPTSATRPSSVSSADPYASWGPGWWPYRAGWRSAPVGMTGTGETEASGAR